MNREMNWEKTAERAKHMIMGGIDIGQFCFQSGTMLPRRSQYLLTPVLQLFGRGIIVVDVFMGEQRAAIGFLAPRDSRERWQPDKRYVVQIADCTTKSCELRACAAIDTDEWPLGRHRTHSINAFPKRHAPRIAKLAEADFDELLVFIWEREPADDFAALLEYVRSL